MVEWCCIEDATAALQGKKTCGHWNEGLVQIFEAVLENKAFILNASRCISREQMENFLFRMTYGLIRGVVDEKSAGHRPAGGGQGFYRGVLQIQLCGGDAGLDPPREKDDHRALARSVGLTMQGSIDNAIRNFLTK